MAFRDLGDWAELAGLRLPIAGKTYTLPPISAELGLRLQALFAAGFAFARGDASAAEQIVLDDQGESDLYREILGTTHDEMTADGVPWAAIKHAAMTAAIDAAVDRETAEKFWASLGKPPGRRPTDRQAPKATAQQTKRASSAGTTSRKTAAKATRGRKSSGTGS